MKLVRFFLLAFALVYFVPLAAMSSISPNLDEDVSQSPSPFDEQELNEVVSPFDLISLPEDNSPVPSLFQSESSFSLEEDKWLYEDILGEDLDLLPMDRDSSELIREPRKAVFVATAEEAPSSPYSPDHEDLVQHSAYLTELNELINEDLQDYWVDTTYETAVKNAHEPALHKQLEGIKAAMQDAQKNVCFAITNDIATPKEIAVLLLTELSTLTGSLQKIIEKKSVTRDEYILLLEQSGKFIHAAVRLLNSVNISNATKSKNGGRASKKAYIFYYKPLLQNAIEGVSAILNVVSILASPRVLYQGDIQAISNYYNNLLAIENEFLPHEYFALCKQVFDIKKWIAHDFAYGQISDLARLVGNINSMIAETKELNANSSIAFGRQYTALCDELKAIHQIAQPILAYGTQQGNITIDAKMRLDIAQIIRAVLSLHVPAQFEYENFELSDSLRVLFQEPPISARSAKRLEHSFSEDRLQSSPLKLSISPASRMWHIDSQDCHYPGGNRLFSLPEWVEYDAGDAMSCVEDQFVFMMTKNPDGVRIGEKDGKALVKHLQHVYGRVAELSERKHSFALTSHGQWISKEFIKHCHAVLASFIHPDMMETITVFKIDPTFINDAIATGKEDHYEELAKLSHNGADFMQTAFSLDRILHRLLQDLQSIDMNHSYASLKFEELNARDKAELLFQIENIITATALATGSAQGVLKYLHRTFKQQGAQTQQTQAQLVTVFLLGQIFKVINFTHLIVADLFGNDEITLQGAKKLLHDAHSYGTFHAEWARNALHNIRPASAAL